MNLIGKADEAMKLLRELVELAREAVTLLRERGGA